MSSSKRELVVMRSNCSISLLEIPHECATSIAFCAAPNPFDTSFTVYDKEGALFCDLGTKGGGLTHLMESARIFFFVIYLLSLKSMYPLKASTKKLSHCSMHSGDTS